MPKLVFAFLLAFAIAPPASGQGLATLPSAHSVRVTLDRFATAVRAEGWIVFTEIDHAAAATAAQLSLPPRTVMIFGNPRTGTAALAAHPTLALDLPMRVLVWEDASGRVWLTRSTGEDIAERVFARHGMTIPTEGRAGTEALMARWAQRAVE